MPNIHFLLSDDPPNLSSDPMQNPPLCIHPIYTTGSFKKQLSPRYNFPTGLASLLLKLVCLIYSVFVLR